MSAFWTIAKARRRYTHSLLRPSLLASVLCVVSFTGCACGAFGEIKAHHHPKPVREPQHGLMCTLRNEAVTESSGVAVSRRDEGIYWTHNDSGDGPNLYAFDKHGNDMGTFTLAEARAIDWEDMASAMVRGRPYLYVGDIGDNSLARKNIIVYRIPEPEPAAGTHRITDYQTYTLIYPDGPHDAETLLVTPVGDIQIVTKGKDGVCGVFGVSSPTKTGVYTLKRLAEIRFGSGTDLGQRATGGDIAPDGKRVVVRTYVNAYLFEAEPATWFAAAPRKFDIAAEAQGEAICFDSVPSRVVTTSEGVPCPVSFALVPR